MWSHTRLAELVEKRRRNREHLPRAEEATLAYARWQGLTNEDNVDRDAAKQTLDETEPKPPAKPAVKPSVADELDDEIPF